MYLILIYVDIVYFEFVLLYILDRYGITMYYWFVGSTKQIT